jgi:hypothetical protein
MVELINRHHRGADRYYTRRFADGAAIIDSHDEHKIVRDKLTDFEAIKLVRQYNDHAQEN